MSSRELRRAYDALVSGDTEALLGAPREALAAGESSEAEP
jgi:hypothetical protein